MPKNCMAKRSKKITRIAERMREAVPELEMAKSRRLAAELFDRDPLLKGGNQPAQIKAFLIEKKYLQAPEQQVKVKEIRKRGRPKKITDAQLRCESGELQKESEIEPEIAEPLKKPETKQGGIFGKDILVNTKFAGEVTLIAGKRGSGKSYTAGVIAEGLHEQEIPFIFFDPQQANLGLGELEGVQIARSSEIENVADFAENCLENNPSLLIVLDGELKKQHEFVRDFLKVYNESMRREVRTILFDEFHVFAPTKERTECKAEIMRMITTKRSDGLGFVIITQRPSAAIDATVAQQVDNLILHRLTGNRDIMAMELLLKYELAEKQEVKSALMELKDYKPGECLILSDSLEKA